MIRAFTTGEARRRFAEIVNKAAFGKERIALLRRGRKIAAVVPFSDMKRLLDLDKRRASRPDPDQALSAEALRQEMAQNR
jgi:prevent-host-death family protein